MKYDEFVLAVEDELKKRQIEYSSSGIFKNGKKLDALLLQTTNTGNIGISPVFYLQAGFDMCNLGMEISSVVDRILNDYSERKDEVSELVNSIKNFNESKQYITCKVINKERNESYVQGKGCLHREFLDLYIIPIIAHGMYVIELTEGTRYLWKVSSDKIFDVALDNLHKEKTFDDCIENVLPEGTVGACSMHVITVTNRGYGASKLLDKKLWKELTHTLGERYWIIPSSVHECIAMPIEENMSVDGIKDFIKEVNSSDAVSEDEYLSDNLYEYTGKEIIIARGGADGEN